MTVAEGVALWAFGPSWFYWTETNKVRVFGIWLMVSGVVAIVVGIAIILYFDRTPVANADESPDEE